MPLTWGRPTHQFRNPHFDPWITGDSKPELVNSASELSGSSTNILLTVGKLKAPIARLVGQTAARSSRLRVSGVDHERSRPFAGYVNTATKGRKQGNQLTRPPRLCTAALCQRTTNSGT